MSEAPAKAWTDTFDELDECPWPGPRPLTRHDEALLIGRGADRLRFVHEVDTHRLIILAGASGVGKTSLVDAGLLPDLTKDDRYTVAVCREWGSDTTADQDAAAFLATKVHASLKTSGYDDLPNGSDLWWALDDRFGPDLVIFLDQFEELLRFDRVLKEGVLNLLVNINKALRTKIVISLRNEYLHELRQLEREATAFSLSRFILEDIDPSFAPDVIRAPEKATSGDEHVIDNSAVVDLASRWQAGREAVVEDVSDPFGRIGLLHLQALLYVLHDRASRGPVTQKVIDGFVVETQSRDAASLFRKGIELAVDVKLQRCRAAFTASGVDDYRIEGVQSLLLRTVPRLSSGSYKIVVSAQDLAGEVLSSARGLLVESLSSARQNPQEPADGPVTEEQLVALDNRLLTLALNDSQSLLTVDRLELADRADEGVAAACSWRTRLHEGADPRDADPGEVSCGPVTGLAPAAVLIEELRRFALVLSWLDVAKLVRITRPGGSQLMVSLIHDGFGEALRRWCRRRASQYPAHEALHALTVPLGAYFNWGSAEVLNGGDGQRVLANMRWRGDTITANFRHVVFVGCDFRGSMFQGCTFEGVTFVNCRLDGTLISDSEIIGGYPDAVGDYWLDEPQFTVSAEGNTLLDALAFYQRTHEDLPRAFLAQHVGLPAIAATQDVARTAEAHVRPEGGGLCIYGGRLSALTIRNTIFRDSGRLSLRHVAGSGLDLVEQGAADLEIFGAGLRHVTITAAKELDPASVVKLLISVSTVIQMWVGDRVPLQGRALDSHLVQFFNGAGSDRMRIDGNTREDLCAGLSSLEGSPASPQANHDVVAKGARMDYVRGSGAGRRANDESSAGAEPSRPV